MSQPPVYNPQHAFVSDSATLSNFPGQQLDVEFQSVKATTDAIETNLALIQRDDGALANGAVGYDQLSASLQTNGISAATAWTTGIAYVVGSAVVQSGKLYRALVAHTSGVFATDLAASKWVFITSTGVTAPSTTVVGNIAVFHDTTGVSLDDSGILAASLAPSVGATLTTPTIISGTISGTLSLGVRDSSAAFDMKIAATSSPVLTAARTLTINMHDADRAFDLSGGLTIATGGFATAGGFATILTATASTNITLPTTGTLATLAGAESLSNKTLVAPALGTPASGVLTNCTGTAAGLTAGSVSTLSANQVTRANLAQGVARSVVGVTGNATANVADIQGTANQFLGVDSGGTTLAFQTMSGDATLASGAITVTKTGGVALTTNATAAVGQLPGTTTNDNAAAGKVGEFISSTVLAGSAVALTASTAANVTSISLTAGDWDVWGNVVFQPAGTTTQSANIAWISTTSATLPTIPNGGAYAQFSVSVAAGLTVVLPAGMTRLSLSGTTTVFLSGLANFAVSTEAAYGFIGARRVR